MQKLLISLVASLVLSAVGVSPAHAQGPVQGNTFAVSLTGLPGDVYQCQTVRATAAVRVYLDGTRAAKPVVLTLWVETPLGRALLSQQTRQIRPGQTVRITAPFATPCPETAMDGTSYPVTLGVSVTIKNETLEATQTSLYHANTQP